MNFKTFILSAAAFASVVSATATATAPTFDAYFPKNEKALDEYKQTVTVINGKMDAITACGASSADFASFKTCVSKLELPQLLVENFPTENYKDAKAVEVAMNAYSAALTKKHEEKTEGKKEIKEPQTDFEIAMDYFLMFLSAGISILFFSGLVMIAYVYFARKSEESDL